MDNIKVSTPSKTYSINITTDFLSLAENFKIAKNGKLINQKICVITDSNVEKLYLDEVMNILKPLSLEISSFVFEFGEQNKTMETIMKMEDFFVEKKLDRNSVVVALGGGVTGDMAGFASAIYMRGISFVQIPTTLLSMVDSSCGGKVGVDFNGNKNMIGAFHQPELVYINVNSLKTLPDVEFSCGMAEVIKHGLIQDIKYYEYLQENHEKIMQLDEDCLIDIVKVSCQIKAKVVSEDEQEHGIRAILNFGHTFGHSVETLSNFSLNHGQCVALGMVSAMHASVILGNITKEELLLAVKTIGYFDLPTNFTHLDKEFSMTKKEIKEQMYLDKKTKQNTLNIVLLEKIGLACQVKNPDINIIDTAIGYITN